jgi:predicted transcriptional regulator
MPLDAVKIGYLRDAAPFGGSPRPASVPGTGMLRKLVRAGMVVESLKGKDAQFVRTEAGEAEIQAFDAALSPGCLAVLRAVGEENRGPLGPDILRRGITRLVEGGLVRVSHFDRKAGFLLTAEGERVRDMHAHEPAPVPGMR